MAAFLLYLV